jgi:hypothetical protein
MRKRDELTDPRSCLNRARADAQIVEAEAWIAAVTAEKEAAECA